jgi:hypothetical protein
MDKKKKAGAIFAGLFQFNVAYSFSKKCATFFPLSSV